MVFTKELPWIWMYAIIVAAWAYWCTRGSDGHLVATVVGFGVLAIVYWIAMYRQRPVKFSTFLRHLAILQTAAIIALAAKPQLDEMGGILNILIPSIVLAIVAGTLIPFRFR
jgi:hypothetical protein